MTTTLRRQCAALAAAAALALSACGGGQPGATIGGTVSTLADGTSVTLDLNSIDNVTVSADGAFTFDQTLAAGTGYDVTVQLQPRGQTCSVQYGTGTVDPSTDPVDNIGVACSANTSIVGSVAGLQPGTQLTLLAAGASTTVGAAGPFSLPFAYADGAAYAVTLAAQPAGQICTVANGSGNVDANLDLVSNVVVTCNAAATLGGTVSGLAAGVTLVLGDGVGSLTVGANGPFAFADLYAAGAPYLATVQVQPAGEVCTVANGAGALDAAADPVQDIVVACLPGATVGGTVSGLASGASVILGDGRSEIALQGNGAFAFSDAFGAGDTYAVTVVSQPVSQVCTVAGGSGTVDGTLDPVTGVSVVCN